MIIIKFETTRVGDDYVCTASCNGVEIANHLNWREAHASARCYDDLAKAGHIEKGTLCIFTSTERNGIDYQFHHKAEKTNRKWSLEELTRAATLLDKSVQRDRVIDFVEWIQLTDMKKEHAVSACWLYSGLHKWNMETKDAVLTILDELFA